MIELKDYRPYKPFWKPDVALHAKAGHVPIKWTDAGGWQFH